MIKKKRCVPRLSKSAYFFVWTTVVVEIRCFVCDDVLSAVVVNRS